jgi:hypothetical protein
MTLLVDEKKRFFIKCLFCTETVDPLQPFFKVVPDAVYVRTLLIKPGNTIKRIQLNIMKYQGRVIKLALLFLFHITTSNLNKT